MARHPTSMGPDYFETMFRETDDPWDLETSAYELAKYQDSIAALSSRTYVNGFEVGCAKGVLTQKLAVRCTALLSVDISKTALEAAQRRTAHFNHVFFEHMAFPGDAPDGVFDLVVFSEVSYYWDDTDLLRAADWLLSHLAIGGDLLLVHFTGDTDYPQSGDNAVFKLFERLSNYVAIHTEHRRPRYRLDLWRRTI